MNTHNSEINVCFILEGKNIDLNEITKRLSIIPSRIRTLEDWPDAIKNPKFDLPDELKPRFVWTLDVGWENSQLVRNRFDTMLELLKEKECVINELP